MCVSAEASFGLTGLLIPVGTYCIAVAWKRDKAFLPLSAIPLVFGIQQFSEGIVWVGISRGDAELTRTASLVFLFFALAFWLIWIPFSAVFLEPRRKFQWLLGVVTLFGLVGGIVFYWPIARDPDVLVTTVVHHSIQYNISETPWYDIVPSFVWHLCYVAVVTAPLFIVSRNKEILFCVALALSAFVSHLIFWYAFASIWCFFAAILSVYLASVFYRLPVRQY